MKLLYIYRYGILGGVCTQIYNRLQYLNSHISVDLLFSHDYGAGTLFQKQNNVFTTNESSNILNILVSQNYDIISIIDTPSVFDLIVEAKKATLITSKVIIEVHTTTQNIQYLTELRQNKVFLQYISAIIVPSIYSQNLINQEYNFKDIIPCFVSYNTITAEIFKPIQLASSYEKKIILWIGKIDSHKNWEDILKIAHILVQKRTDVHFVLIGGKTVSNEMEQKFLKLINDLDIQDNITWLPLVDYSQISIFYNMTVQSGGVHVITSKNESFGMTIIEASLCHCPVIASQVGALPELLNPISNKTLFPVNDCLLASQLINQHLDTPQTLQSAFKEISEEYKTFFAPENQTKKYLDLICSFIKH